jgi:hypothetical protein
VFTEPNTLNKKSTDLATSIKTQESTLKTSKEKNEQQRSQLEKSKQSRQQRKTTRDWHDALDRYTESDGLLSLRKSIISSLDTKIKGGPDNLTVLQKLHDELNNSHNPKTLQELHALAEQHVDGYKSGEGKTVARAIQFIDNVRNAHFHE